jgi:threonine dehydrogenase-like Zn-dependent dehydrogenase
VGPESSYIANPPQNLCLEEAALAECLECVINGQELSAVGLDDTILILGAALSAVCTPILPRCAAPPG